MHFHPFPYLRCPRQSNTHLLLQACDAEAVITGWVQELTQHPATLSRLGGVAVSHALVGLLGHRVATSVLLMGRGVQGRFGVRGVRQGPLPMARAHGVGGHIPLVWGNGSGRAALLIKHRCCMAMEAGAGVGVCMRREVGVEVGVCVEVGLTVGVRERAAL